MRVDKQASTCSKFMYTTEREAQEIITKCKSASSRSKIPKRKYYCKECGGWHVTSQKTKSKFQ
ncbi:hypothetical protein AOB46_11345 [Chryseobacterium indologenes]|uniref:Uncharacterized protein n=1 Tax=Chryseobacterium indologenes TaxID=253 RepID=A0A0N0IWB5_CHRID|nr:hypothetical protein AOB46_11345 [Chryseobacterium indologenes]